MVLVHRLSKLVLEIPYHLRRPGRRGVSHPQRVFRPSPRPDLPQVRGCPSASTSMLSTSPLR